MAKKPGREAAPTPTVPLGTYDRYKDKRINDQDLVDHKVSPPERSDIEKHTQLTMANMGGYLSRAKALGSILETALGLGDFPDGDKARDQATVMFVEAIEDVYQARRKLDELHEEIFLTYRQKEGSVLHVERGDVEPQAGPGIIH